jgi:chromosome segregation ATPase
MIYLVAQTWLFLAIACLIGMLMGYFLLRNQKLERQSQLETEALDARHRAIAMERELEDYRGRLAELEGLPPSARASRIASREEMAQRIGELERDVSGLRASEKSLTDESARMKAEADSFRTRYLEARAKWDEYKAKADALQQASAPLDLGGAKIMPDDAMRKRLLELEGTLAEVSKEKDRIGDQARTHMARVRELERQLAGGAPAPDAKTQETIKAMQVRLSELEGQLAQATGERDASAVQIRQMLARIRELEGAGAAGAENGNGAARLAEAVQSRDQALQEVAALSARLAAAEARANSGQSDRDAASNALNVSKARIAELEARLASGFVAARETDALRSRILDLQDKLASAETVISKSLDRVRQETDPLKARIAELETRLAHAAATNTQGDTIAALQNADNVELRAKLMAAEERALLADALKAEVETLNRRLAETPLMLDTPVTEDAQVEALRQRISELETSLERAMARPAETVLKDTPDTTARMRDLEAALERMQRQAADAETLRAQVATLDARLAEALARARTEAPADDTIELRTRLADVEARLQAGTQASAQVAAESGALRHRVQLLEAMLHEAAKSRDEAAVLRAKVAELDGRLGQTMKALAEARATQNQTV